MHCHHNHACLEGTYYIVPEASEPSTAWNPLLSEDIGYRNRNRATSLSEMMPSTLDVSGCTTITRRTAGMDSLSSTMRSWSCRCIHTAVYASQGGLAPPVVPGRCSSALQPPHDPWAQPFCSPVQITSRAHDKLSTLQIRMYRRHVYGESRCTEVNCSGR